MTPTNKRKQRDALEAPFQDGCLKEVSRSGRRLTYVPVGEVKQRLNEVLDSWSWKLDYPVARDTHDPDWVIAQGTMVATIDGEVCVAAGVGGAKVKRYSADSKNAGELVDLGDDYKAAESYALKKAAQSFGVGLYLSRTPEAIAAEMERQAERDPLDEGWDTVEEANDLVRALSQTIRGLPADLRSAARAERDRMGIIWPPTRDEYDDLAEFVRGLIVSAPETDDTVADAPAPPEPDSAPENAAGADSGDDDGIADVVLLFGDDTDDADGTEDTATPPDAPDAAVLVIGSDPTPEPDDAPTVEHYDPADDSDAEPAPAVIVEQVREMIGNLAKPGKEAFMAYREQRGWSDVKAEDLNAVEILDLVEFLAELPTA